MRKEAPNFQPAANRNPKIITWPKEIIPKKSGKKKKWIFFPNYKKEIYEKLF